MYLEDKFVGYLSWRVPSSFLDYKYYSFGGGSWSSRHIQRAIGVQKGSLQMFDLDLFPGVNNRGVITSPKTIMEHSGTQK